MQSLDVPAARNPNGHSPDEIRHELRGASGSRRLDFRYDLLDVTGAKVADLDAVQSCTITQNWHADIKRTAKLSIRDIGGIDYLSDMIKPWIRFYLPPYQAADWVEWPQGVFLLSTPRRKSTPAGVVTREVEAYDRLQALADDKPPTRQGIMAGESVTGKVSSLIGALPKVVTPSTSVAPRARDWDIGTSKLQVINELLDSIAYESVSFDSDGVAQVRPYVLPSARSEEYRYGDDLDSGLVVPAMDQELDLFRVPNQWVLTVSDPDRAALVAAHTNNDPGSLTSTVRRGRVITDFRVDQDAADLTALQAKVARLAYEASQVYESIPFTTALMPHHDGNDVYRLRYAPLAINAKYVEQSWEMALRPGATMRHVARRAVELI